MRARRPMLKQERLRKAFSLAGSFISRPCFLRRIGPRSQGGFSCGMITQQRHFTSDIWGQQFPSWRQPAEFFTREHCSRCGGQIQATVFVFAARPTLFRIFHFVWFAHMGVLSVVVVVWSHMKAGHRKVWASCAGWGSETHWAYESELSGKKAKQATEVETH